MSNNDNNLRVYFSSQVVELSNYNPEVKSLKDSVLVFISKNQIDLLEVDDENLMNLSGHEQFDLISFIYHSCKEFDFQHTKFNSNF